MGHHSDPTNTYLKGLLATRGCTSHRHFPQHQDNRRRVLLLSGSHHRDSWDASSSKNALCLRHDKLQCQLKRCIILSKLLGSWHLKEMGNICTSFCRALVFDHHTRQLWFRLIYRSLDKFFSSWTTHITLLPSNSLHFHNENHLKDDRIHMKRLRIVDHSNQRNLQILSNKSAILLNYKLDAHRKQRRLYGRCAWGLSKYHPLNWHSWTMEWVRFRWNRSSLLVISLIHRFSRFPLGVDLDLPAQNLCQEVHGH